MSRNIFLLKIHALMLGGLFIMPVIVPFFRDVIGLDFKAFMICQAVFSAAVIALEVPTGWIADVWTRRRALIIGTGCFVLGYLALWQARSLPAAIGAEIIIAGGVSLLSGTKSALVYESLPPEESEAGFRKHFGAVHAMGLYGIAGASLAGGFLYALHPEAPVIMTAATGFCAFIISLFVREPARPREAPHKNPFADMAETVRYAVHGHADIAGIIMISALVFACTKIFIFAQQPYYTALNLPVELFGVLSAAGFVIGALAGHFGHGLAHRVDPVVVLQFLLVYMIFACVLSGAMPGWHGIPLLLGGSFVFGYGWPRMQNAINDHAPPARRATILSAANLMIHVVTIPVTMMTGWAEDKGGIGASLLTLAGVMMLCGGAGWRLTLKRGRQDVPE